MKKIVGAILLSFFLLGISLFNRTGLLKDNNATEINSEELDGEEKKEAKMEEIYRMDYLQLRNPLSGKIPADIGEREDAVAKSFANQVNHYDVNGFQYSFQGPSNLAGRIRALCFDRNDLSSNTLMVGGVSGGLFKSINGGASWTKINLPGQRHYTINAIAQDPRPGFGNIWYCAGGAEIFGGSASYNAGIAGHLGDGVFKSIDNGNTWFRLVNSNTGLFNQFDRGMDNIHNIVVSHLNGDIYVACTNAIVRSIDGGDSWQEVIDDGTGNLGNFQVSEVCINDSGKIFAGFANSASIQKKGIWMSETGNPDSWIKITSTNNPPDIQSANRIKIVRDYDGEGLLILFNNNLTPGTCLPRANLYRYNSISGVFTEILLPDCNFFPSGRYDPQAGYNLIVYAAPSNPNLLFVGGTNLYRSVDAGASWVHIGGFEAPSNPNGDESHVDVHSITFSPSNDTMLFVTDDGGIRKGNALTTTVDWIPLNNSLPTFQYYHVAINPNPGIDNYIGGAQDNGTTSSFNSGAAHTQIFGGDGVSVGIGRETNPVIAYLGFQNGEIYRATYTQSGLVSSFPLRPSGFSSEFITNFYLDPDNTNYLYYLSNQNKLLRIKNASTATFQNWELFDFSFHGNPSSIATTRGAYTSSSKLYIGTSMGKIYKLNDPINTAASTFFTDITPPIVLIGAYCKGLSVNPTNDNELMAVYSNYDIISIWLTRDAGMTWESIEGNLSLPSVRTCKIAIVDGQPQYFVGTSIGLFHTTVLNGFATPWQQQSQDLIGNALVVSLAYRPEDNVLLIGTHGSGMYKAILTNTTVPVTLLTFEGTAELRQNRLNWTTSNEQNNKGFNIEHSADGNDFYPIGYVPAQIFPGFPNKYSFVHKSPASNLNYYRLKQIDQNSSFAYSKTILIRNKPETTIRILGNPVRSQLRALIQNGSGKDFVLQITNMNGTVVLTKQMKSTTTGIIDIPVHHLNSGRYVCTWRFADGEIITNNFLIVR